LNWLWIKVLQDPAISHVSEGWHPQVYYELDLISDLDPAFYDVYIAGANLLSVVRNDNAGALELLTKGKQFMNLQLPTYPPAFQEEYWKGAWDIPLLMAYVYLFEMNDMPHAAQAFQVAANYPEAPFYLKKLEKRLKAPGGHYEVGLRLLNFMISGARSQKIKDQLEEKRNSLFVAQFLFNMNTSFREFLVRIPEYQKDQQALSAERMQHYWQRYKKETKTSDKDPWGGDISLDASGKVVSTTPHSRVFGLE
jgi:hypothetical protein